jgi:uncharacterized protein
MTCRILSIDGGGIRGVFPAAFLASLEEALNCRVADYFDLIVGTSTGGIIALGLGLGWPASEILQFYKALGPKVFAGNPLLRSLRHLGISKYSQEPLRQALEEKFGKALLGESAKRLVIPSLNLENGQIHLYKTAHHRKFRQDYKERVVDVALATAAAPSYFPTQTTGTGIPLIDGGVWANNPVAVAVIEAIGVLGWPREALRVLSLGCTTPPFDVGSARHLPLGLGPWAVKIANVFMAGQSSGALGMAYTLIGHDSVFRIAPVTPKDRYGLDTVSTVNSLAGLGAFEGRNYCARLEPVFFAEIAKPFEPFYEV